jgi:hypothetical protein
VRKADDAATTIANFDTPDETLINISKNGLQMVISTDAQSSVSSFALAGNRSGVPAENYIAMYS